MKAKDLSVSIIVGFSWVLLANLLNGIYTSPDLSAPTLKTKTTSTTSEFSVIPVTPKNGGALDFLQLVFYIVIIAIAVGIVYGVYRLLRGSSFIRRMMKSPPKSQSLEKRVKSVSDARIKARSILERGLETGEYTWAVIEAYRVLDKELDAFRAIARPKHWTPKEYAYHVSRPIYQPAIKGIVEIFYRVQYGNQNARKEDVLDFLVLLDGIFVDEITPTKGREIANLIQKHDLSYDEVLIPRVADFTKPFMPGETVIEKEEDKDE